MSVCKVCGKKYSKWTTPVSAHGVCTECFALKLATKPKDEAPKVTNDAPLSVASAAAPHAGSGDEKAILQPRTPIEIFVETLGVTLALFGGRILLGWLEPGSKSLVTTQELVASSLTYLGWSLVVICLLNRTAQFQWRLPGSKRAWRHEIEWGVLLFLIGVSVRALAYAIGREMNLRSGQTAWHQVMQNHNTWLAYQFIVPISAFYQELVYRVYLQSRLTQILRGRPVLVVLLCSWLFAAMHGYPPLQTLGIFVTGLLYGTSYQLNGKIPRLMIAHTVNNIVASLG